VGSTQDRDRRVLGEGALSKAYPDYLGVEEKPHRDWQVSGDLSAEAT
jgi:hypothetical protein